jgi:ubiquinone/menaquinone biosynthesis C-methylase UbiE
MNTSEAVALIEGAVRGHEGTWADLGAGDGTFTRALGKLLGPKSRIYAVDRDTGAVVELERWSASAAENVIPVEADFTGALDLPELGQTLLDGMLLANALHFVRDAGSVLTRLVKLVRPGGRVVLVEYDQREASRWVPYPIPIANLPALATAAGLSTPTVTATRPSTYRGVLYAAAADRVVPG